MYDIMNKGVCGNCRWEIDEGGTLTISPVPGTDGKLEEHTLESRWPWCGTGSTIEKVVVKNGVRAGKCLRSIFAGFTACREFDLAGLNTEDTEDMAAIFMNCQNLQDISSVTEWATQNVKDMAYMLYDCQNLVDVRALSAWKTNKLELTNSMFYNCASLADLSPLTSWDMTNVSNMNEMFCCCRSLTDLAPISGWNTGNVKEMASMFAFCSSLENVEPIAAWDTKNTIYIDNIFARCSVLEIPDAILDWPMACPREGAFQAWKKCYIRVTKLITKKVLVKLLIPEDARRSSAGGHRQAKCRADKAYVLGFYDLRGNVLEGISEAVSLYTDSFIYRDTEMVSAVDFDEDRFRECAPGIHFFMDMEAAARY